METPIFYVRFTKISTRSHPSCNGTLRHWTSHGPFTWHLSARRGAANAWESTDDCHGRVVKAPWPHGEIKPHRYHDSRKMKWNGITMYYHNNGNMWKPLTINCAHKLYTPWVKLHTHVANVNAKRKNFGNSPFENESAQTPSNLRGCQKKMKQVRSACLLINWTQLFSLHPQQKTTHSIFRFIPVSTVGKTLDCTQRVLHLMQLPPWLVTCKNQLKIQINSVQTKLHWHWQGDFVFSGNQTGCCECRKWCQAKKLRESLQTCSCWHNISPHVHMFGFKISKALHN